MSRAARLAAELARRQRQKTFSADALCGDFPSQRGFVVTTAKRVVACCSRRAGKTEGGALKFLFDAVKPPYADQFYVAPTLKNARQIIWPKLKRFNAEYELGGVANEAEAFMRFPKLPNEPRIILGGMKDASEVERLRGHHGKKFHIDEAQSGRQTILQSLLDDVAEPALLDYDGQLVVSGTPGPVMAGFFHEIYQGSQSHGWEQHHWTMRDNPHLPRLSGRPIEDILREIRERHGWTEESPTYRREYLGEWVQDLDALMFHYDAVRNGCAWQWEPQEGWTYVIGFDLGYEDADAIAILGWPKNERTVYLCAEYVKQKQGITELGNTLAELHKARRPIRCPGDMGGLGKKIGAELQMRWQLPVEAADKARKAEHIELLNDALRTGAFRAPPDSRFAQDAAIMQWDMEAKHKGILREDPGYHSDICDAVLYAYRVCLAFVEQPAPEKPKDEGDRLLQARIERIEREKNQPWWERSGGRLGF